MKNFTRLLALALVAMMMLSAVPANAAVSAISGNSKTTTAPASTHGFTIRPIEWDGAMVGQFALPDTYTGYWSINCCDNSTCLGFPVRTQVTISSNKEDTRMIYYYGEQFLERVYDSTGLSWMKEGALDPQLAIIHKYYTDAAGYCDQLATSWAPEAVFYKEEDMSFYNSLLEDRQAEFSNEIIPVLESIYGTKVDWTNFEGAQRVYTFDISGQTYCICVMVEMGAYEYTTSGYGVTYRNIIWQVPCYYILWTPIENYQRIHDGDFQIFVENTSVNDEMRDLNDKLTEKIAADVIANMNMVVAASSAYMTAMTDLTFSMVESNMSSGSYTGSYSSDRFSDYLFDQNDYTLSDGSSVKVSSSYNYVWEGSNGTVYYGNSLSDAPGGTTQLYPNR